MLVELGLVEQRYKAVLEVLNDGASVTDVARRYGVGRQTVHKWLRRYAIGGLGGLVDKSSRPDSCPHQMPPPIEARVLEMRRLHPGWGPRTILNRLIREGAEPIPDRSSIYRALVRHRLIFPSPRKRKASDYKRWERSRPMELWQMDVTAGISLPGSARALIVTGIDDHSRFCVCAKVVARATAKPVCDALLGAMEAHGLPEAILTDNGKVFTGRFGPGHGTVLFDRICAENGIRHLLTAPLADDDGEGGAIPQDDEARVLGRPGLRFHRSGPRRARRLGVRVQLASRAPESGEPAPCGALRLGSAPTPRSTL